MPDSAKVRSPKETLPLLQIYIAVARSITIEEAAALWQALEHQDSLQPLLDPTAWREVAGPLSVHLRLARAFLDFRQEIERIAPQPPAQGDDHAAR